MKNSDDFKPASSREYHAKRMMQKTVCSFYIGAAADYSGLEKSGMIY